MAVEAIRVIQKSGESGRTLSELVKYSRKLRSMGMDSLAALMDVLEAAGSVVKVNMRNADRGKSRDAYLSTEYHNAVVDDAANVIERITK